MLLSCCILILLLLILLLVLSLPLIRCCCTFFSICHFYVVYGSAVRFLGFSRGIGLHIYYIGTPQYTMLVFRFPSLHTLRQYIRQRCNCCIQCIYLFIMTIYFYYYNTMHRYINTHSSV